MPAAVSKALNLDGARHWLRLDELNRFVWPGYDLRPIPGAEGDYAYGMLPQSLFETMRDRIVALHKARRGRSQDRG